MIRVTLLCGCPSVVHYRTRVKWEQLPEKDRTAILARVKAEHQCPKPPPKAPAVSPEPQKP